AKRLALSGAVQFRRHFGPLKPAEPQRRSWSRKTSVAQTHEAGGDFTNCFVDLFGQRHCNFSAN
ncbi:MAG TPA: hypothetical protein PKZ32_09955, partial [Candidatus Melainabacteria bacterium]|nr:hypothetical protein [Candidatus Melainabacteria bacterium]